MPKDDINYSFTENGVVYDFYDVFVPTKFFYKPYTLWTWGSNSSGQLGINGTIGRNTPVTTFLGGKDWVSIAGGGSHTAAIKTDGSLWTWGSNGNGQLGINDTIDRSTPVTTFLGGNDWKSIATGNGHTVAIKTDGSLWTWGYNNSAQLGTNDTIDRSTPVTTFLGGNDWKSVAGGITHTLAIKTDGSLWVWGYNSSGQLGINDTNTRSTPVTTFLGGNNWKSVAGGFFYSAALKTDGSLWTWGSGSSAQLGTNDTNTRSTPVTTFLGGNDWASISVSSISRHTLAIKTDGSLWCWGRNFFGQLGTNDYNTRTTPVTTFLGGNDWKSIAGGSEKSAAIKTDGSLWNWGANTASNDNIIRNTPVTTFLGGNDWKSIAGGGSHTVAIEYLNP